MAFGLERVGQLPPVVEDELNQLTVGIRAQLEAEHDEEGRHLPYEDYQPELHAFTTEIVIANGTIKGRWCRRGRAVFVKIHIVMGSNTTFGSGPFAVSLPVRPRDIQNVFQVACLDASAGTVFGATGRNTSGDNPEGKLVRMNYVTGAFISATVPFTWTDFDELMIQGDYEAAED